MRVPNLDLRLEMLPHSNFDLSHSTTHLCRCDAATMVSYDALSKVLWFGFGRLTANLPDRIFAKILKAATLNVTRDYSGALL